MQTDNKYINPLTDFAFKRIFGTDSNKDLLLDFLNAMFNGDPVITDLQYDEPTNLRGATPNIIPNALCTHNGKEHLIVLVQNPTLTAITNRTLYNAMLAISLQKRYLLTPVHVIAIADPTMPGMRHDNYINDYSLRDRDNLTETIDLLNFKYIEIGLFNKTPDQLTSQADKWIYALKNLPTLDHIPAPLDSSPTFQKLFLLSQTSTLSPSDLAAYHDSLTAYHEATTHPQE